MLGLGVPASAQRPKIITFDAPGAGTVPQSYDGTFPAGINPDGSIPGYYLDPNSVMHGFLRARNGMITEFDVPGAAAPGTLVEGMNPQGAITGTYFVADGANYGYVRAPDGTFTTFKAAPGAPQTNGCDINPKGTIAGGYLDINNVGHGFLRAADGTFTTFDYPGAVPGNGSSYYMGTFYGLNPAGAVTGCYYDADSVSHGWLRTPEGEMIVFNVPSAGTGAYEGTFSWSINPAGAITGWYVDADSVAHGYALAADGRFITFDAPGAGTAVGSGEGTYPIANNPAGAITGWYVDANYLAHGFLRAPDGKFTIFDAPGAGTVVGSWQGTYPMGNNPAGVTTGYYLDANNVYHGFLRPAMP
jgi:hypothetical protein